MIKVERNISSEKIEKAKEVLDALRYVFNNKCYICENKKVTSYNIEHNKPHRNLNKDLKFEWENLFLACAHCNNIKSDKYENILDCTKVEVDELISFRKQGSFAWDERIEIQALENSEYIRETVDLLIKVYDGTTPMKKLESSNIRKELRSELQKFINAINEYEETDGVDKEDAEMLIIRELKSNSPFAAFKRWIIRDNKEKLSRFLKDDGIKCITR